MSKKIDEILSAISHSRNKDKLDKRFYPEVDISDYFFVSYSHKDYRPVYKDLIRLKQSGLKLWYDRDIPAGANWKEVVNRFMRPVLCKGVIFYISENSLRDKKSTKQTIAELQYAKEIGKPIIAINLTTKIEKEGRYKTVVLSAEQMIDTLIAKGRKDLIPFKDEIVSVFPNDLIYLPITLNAAFRVEKIQSSLKEPPKLILKDDNFIEHVTDSTIINITSGDIQKLLADLGVDGTYFDYSFYIRACAFSNCESLESIDFSVPHLRISIDNIDNYAFSNCTSLEEINFGSTLLVDVGTGAFSGCTKLKNLNTTFKITGPYTFYNCESLQRVEITQDSIFGDYVFDGCSSLEEIVVQEVTHLDYIAPVSSPEKIGNCAFRGCEKLKEMVVFRKVKEYGNDSFAYCQSLKELFIYDGITKVGHGAFNHCDNAVKASILSPSVEMDISSVFMNCENLEEIYITPENKDYGVINNAVYQDKTLVFYPQGAKQEKLIIADDCEEIKMWGITLNKNLKEIVLNKHIKEIASQILGCYSLEKVTVPEDNPYFTSINGIVYSKDLTELVFVPSMAVIKEFIVPDHVLYINPKAFCDSNVEKVIFPDHIKKIHYIDYVRFKEIVLPSQLESLSFASNSAMPQLEKISIKDNENFITFKDGNCLVKKEGNNLSIVCVAAGLKELIIPEKVTYMNAKVLVNSNVKTLVLPSSLKEFYINDNLEDLETICVHKNTKFVIAHLLLYILNLKVIVYYGTTDDFKALFNEQKEELIYVHRKDKIAIICEDGNLEYNGNPNK